MNLILNIYEELRILKRDREGEKKPLVFILYN